ncbi:hypothetical protein G7067_00555 [Leucobacter insecticola]|uniref:Uncharacterized protein n=1 Tax=Leucobacter insecticola TaxID=2714934 RepID=A0A6G8FFZ0_9MICO|nr:hypothetical protein [Leucobacter insecticola]QIM15245.1 hypothetical protein G7067_00555 [Leucobacter insecticola]
MGAQIAIHASSTEARFFQDPATYPQIAFSATTSARALAFSIETSQNGGMITMNEPQVWTVIGVFAASMAVLITAFTQTMSAKFERVIDRVDGLKTEMVIRFEKVDQRFEQVDRRFEQVDQRFEQVDRRFEQVDQRFERVDERFGRLEARVDGIETRLDGIDRDVQTVITRVFPLDE